MYSTNLLPPLEKRKVRLEELRRAVIFFAVLLSALFFIGSLLLLPSFFPLFFEKREAQRRLDLEKETLAKFRVNDILAETNTIQVISAALKNFASQSGRASELLDLFLLARGREIEITSLSVSQDGKVILSGTALTRQALLSFEGALRDSGRFSSISSPLSNIIQETNINFSLGGQLKSGL